MVKSLVQPGFDSCSKLIETTQEQREFSLLANFIPHVLGLLFHLFQPLSHMRHPGFKFFFLDESFSITVDQSSNALS